jgi:hypothetical protein
MIGNIEGGPPNRHNPEQPPQAFSEIIPASKILSELNLGNVASEEDMRVNLARLFYSWGITSDQHVIKNISSELYNKQQSILNNLQDIAQPSIYIKLGIDEDGELQFEVAWRRINYVHLESLIEYLKANQDSWWQKLIQKFERDFYSPKYYEPIFRHFFEEILKMPTEFSNIIIDTLFNNYPYPAVSDRVRDDFYPIFQIIQEISKAKEAQPSKDILEKLQSTTFDLRITDGRYVFFKAWSPSSDS